MDEWAIATLHKATNRLREVEHKLSDGHIELRAETFGIVLRHTAGILAALNSAVVADVMASS